MNIFFIIFSLFFIAIIAIGSYANLEPFFFCDSHKPSEDWITIKSYVALDTKLHCGFETKPELPYDYAYSIYYVTQKHGYVCDYWCYNWEGESW